MSDSENRYEPGKDEHGLFMGRTGDGRFVLYASYLDTKARAEKAEAERDRLREALELLEKINQNRHMGIHEADLEKAITALRTALKGGEE